MDETLIGQVPLMYATLESGIKTNIPTGFQYENACKSEECPVQEACRTVLAADAPPYVPIRSEGFRVHPWKQCQVKKDIWFCEPL